MRKSLLTTIILTYNESLHIERCIKSVQAISDRIIVVDSYSNDNTIEIALANGAEVYQNPFVNQAIQLNWGIDNARIDSNWIMRMDADEYLTEELRRELVLKLPLLSNDVTGLTLNYRHYFFGKWIKHGTRYPIPLLRIWRNGIGSIENKWMDERVVLSHGKTQQLNSDFIHDDLNDLSFFISKHNGYATREAIDLLNKEYKVYVQDEPQTSKSHLSLYLKNKFYSGSFLFIRVFIYFFYRFIIRLGFLDGVQGLMYHFLQGFWYRFLVDAKIWELKRKFGGDREKIVAYLREKYSPPTP